MPGGPRVYDWKKVRIIKMSLDTDLIQYEIAHAMNVRQSTVSKILAHYRKEVNLWSPKTQKP